MRITLVLVVACGQPASPRVPDLATLGAPGLHAIDPAKLEANTKFLSSDELAGRGTGTAGGARAEQYIAEQFAALGLEPAGEHGTYFQTVPLREATRIDAQTSLVFHAHGGDVELIGGRDAALFGDPHAADVSIDAPLVFVGYGLAIPGYDDLAGVDLHGAIAVVFGGAPRTIGGHALDTSQHAVMSDTKVRTRALRDRGARAMIVVYDPSRAERMPFAEWLPKTLGSSMAWLDEHGEPGSMSVLPTVVIGEASLDKLLAGRAHAAWTALDKGEVTHVELGATASLRIRSEVHDVTARNVVGLLRGSDPAGETVVYTAHSDHLGIGPAIDGDTIYNGALDNAVGVAAILEIARAFRALPQPPRRSILFLAVTGEEKGLLGSDYFARHPTLPINHVVADINIDGLTVNWEAFDIVPLGAEHSTLAAHVSAAARATGYAISDDPEPQQVFFIRSDQYSFVQRGVPSIFPTGGYKDAHGATAANLAISDAWAAEHYHRPSDVWRPEYRASWGVHEAGFDFLVGLSVATTAERPHWNPGDAFGHSVSGSTTAP